jgi:hypothetical protein
MDKTLTNIYGFTEHEIKQYTKHYIWPQCQGIDPSIDDDVCHTFALRNDLQTVIDQALARQTAHKYIILLGESGMGKTAFFCNYFLRHLKYKSLSINLALLSLNCENDYEIIQKIPASGKTALFVDGFNEYTTKNSLESLIKLMNMTRDFYRVIIACQTQIFPPNDTLPIIVTSVQNDLSQGHEAYFTFKKIFLSPFSQEQINAYLKNRYSFWENKSRHHAHAVIDSLHSIKMTPMILANIDELMYSEKTFLNTFDIYNEIIEAWLNRETSVEKQTLCKFIKRIAIEVFAQIGVEMFVGPFKGGECVILQEAEKIAKTYGIDLALWAMSDNPILAHDDKGNFKFTHRVFLDFLFAFSLLEQDPEALKVPSSLWTEQVKYFLIQGMKAFHGNDQSQLIFHSFFIRFNGGIFKLKETGRYCEVKPFEMSIYLVTNIEYEAFDIAHRRKRDRYSYDDRQPVANVSWDEANQYCQWLSKTMGGFYRLPSEAEWEFAASGQGKRAYPWGNEEPSPERANYADSCIGNTTIVGSYIQGMTSEGLFDMAGNVAEWCSDWFDDREDSHVVKGGSFDSAPEDLQCSTRKRDHPMFRNLLLGFRVVRSVNL